jgi:hypothetical protein
MFRQNLRFRTGAIAYTDRHGRSRRPKPHRIRRHALVSRSGDPAGFSQVRPVYSQVLFLSWRLQVHERRGHVEFGVHPRRNDSRQTTLSWIFHAQPD